MYTDKPVYSCTLPTRSSRFNVNAVLVAKEITIIFKAWNDKMAAGRQPWRYYGWHAFDSFYRHVNLVTCEEQIYRNVQAISMQCAATGTIVVSGCSK